MSKLRASLAVAALALTGCGGASTSEPAATTAPFVPNGSDSIVVIGDFGVGGSEQQRLGAAVRTYVREEGAGLLVTVGDNDYAEDSEEFTERWTESFGWTSEEGVLVAGSLGNHDVFVEGGRYQYDELSMPRRYYRERFGEVDLFVLDSNVPNEEVQRVWLGRELAASDARWKIGVFHHPPYNCGRHSNQTGMKPIVDLMRAGGVQLVLTGHDHNYQRFEVEGLTQLVAGFGGADFYRVGACPAGIPEPVFARDDVHGFVALDVGAERIEGVALTVRGDTVDRFAIRR